MATNLPKLAQPALRGLQGAGISTLEGLAAFTEGDIKKLHGLGPNAIGKLREAMQVHGIEFAPEPIGDRSQ